jgi:SSS family solute:Na+ symporter
MDVTQRQKEIDVWDSLNAKNKAEAARPQSLRIGDSFEKKHIVPGQGIFWTKGIRTDLNGSRSGRGDLNVELFLLDKTGFDLSENLYALNETLRIAIRTSVPFIILILAALLAKPDDRKMLDRFFAKMKTKVLLNKEQDAKELALSYENPHRFDHNKLFPASDWEFEKWDKEDFWGVVISILIILAIIAAIKLLVTIGG